MKIPPIVLLLIATLAIAPAAQAVVVQSTLWGTATAPIEVGAGDTAKALTVLIHNDNQTTYSNARATLVGNGGDVYPTPGADTASLAGSFAPGDVWAAKLFVNVHQEANAFTRYTLPLIVELYDRGNSTSVTYELSVSFQITGRALLTMSASPSTLVVGRDTLVDVTVTNVGSGPASNVNANLATAQGGVALVRSDSLQALGALASKQSTTFRVTVRASTEGASSLAATLSYLDSVGQSASASRSVSFDASARPWENVEARLENEQVDAGRVNILNFTIWNNESYALSNARGSAAVSGALVVPDASDVQSLGSLEAGSVSKMQVSVVTDSTARGLQKVPLTLAWTRLDGSTATRAFNLAVPVVGTVRPSVSGVTATLNNQTNAASIAGSITNLGNTQALNAYVQILPNANYQSTEAQFIGDLSPNTAVPFTIATTILNATLLNATRTSTPGGGALPTGAGGFPGGAPPGNGTFPGGGSGAPPGNGTFPQGNFPRGNGTFPAGGQGGRGVGNAVQVLVTWTDDYGNTASQILSVAITPRVAATSTTTRGVGASADNNSILGIPSLGIGLLIVGVAAAAVGFAVYLKRNRS